MIINEPNLYLDLFNEDLKLSQYDNIYAIYLIRKEFWEGMMPDQQSRLHKKAMNLINEVNGKLNIMNSSGNQFFSGNEREIVLSFLRKYSINDIIISKHSRSPISQTSFNLLIYTSCQVIRI